MRLRNPRKAMRVLSVVSGLIGLAAVVVGVIALDKKEYIIATAMLLVAVWQLINLLSWKKLR